MDDSINRQDAKPGVPVATAEIRAYLKAVGSLGGGFRLLSRETLSMMAKLSAPRRWKLRRERLGDSGRKQKPYGQWRKEQGLPPLSEQEGGSQ